MRKGGQLTPVGVGEPAGRPQPVPQVVAEQSGHRGVLPGLVRLHLRDDVELESCVDVAGDVPGKVPDGAQFENSRPRREPSQQVGGPLVLGEIPGCDVFGHSLQPDDHRVGIDVEHPDRPGHRQALGQPSRQIGAVDLGFDPPRVGGGGDLAHLGRDLLEGRRVLPRLDVLHEQPEGLLPRRSPRRAAHPVPPDGRDGRDVVGHPLDRRVEDFDGVVAEQVGNHSGELVVGDVGGA